MYFSFMDAILLHGGHQRVLNHDPDDTVCSPYNSSHIYIIIYTTPQNHTPNKFLILIFYPHSSLFFIQP